MTEIILGRAINIVGTPGENNLMRIGNIGYIDVSMTGASVQNGGVFCSIPSDFIPRQSVFLTANGLYGDSYTTVRVTLGDDGKLYQSYGASMMYSLYLRAMYII